MTNNTVFLSRLDELDRFADSVEKSLEKSGNDPSQYLHHPVNVFQLLNRYYNGWMKLGDMVYQDNARGTMLRGDVTLD